MTCPMEQPESPLERRVREQLGDRECPLCGQQAWDFGGARRVPDRRLGRERSR